MIRFKKDDGTDFPEWEEKKFYDVFIIMQNNTFSRDMLNYCDGSIQNIHYGDVLIKFGSTIDCDNTIIPYINDEVDTSKFKEECFLKDGDIVLADTAEDYSAGKVTEIYNVGDKKILSGLHTMLCRPLFDFSSKYLGYYMNSEEYHKQIVPLLVGTKVYSINKKVIGRTKIKIPHPNEQKKIADFLSEVDNMISIQKQQLAALKEQKKGVMQKIFSQEVRFKKDNGTDFPEWEEKDILNIAETYIGLVTTMTEHYVLKGVPLIRNSDIKENRFVFKESIYLDEEFATKNKSRQHKIGDIITVHTGDVGTSAVIDEDLDGSIGFATIVTRIINPKEILPQYICWYYNSPKNKQVIFNMITGDGRNNLNMKDFNRLKIPIPQLDEQKKISDFLSKYDKAIEIRKKKLETWKTLKRGLLQQMFI